MVIAEITGRRIPQSELNANSVAKTPLNLGSLSAETLVSWARKGDAEAFGCLLDRHYRFALSRAYSILRNYNDAEDAVQTACTEAWKHLGQFHGGGTFGGWFSRIVSNECLMQLRRQNRQVSLDEVLDSEDSFRMEAIDQRALPERQTGDGEVSQVLGKEIRGIPPLLRTVLILRDLRERPITDVAMQLQISVPAAKSRLTRARAELKKRLEKHLGERGCGTLNLKSCRRQVAYVRVG